MGIKFDPSIPFKMSDKEINEHNAETRHEDDKIAKDGSGKNIGTKFLGAVAKIRGVVRLFDAIRVEDRLLTKTRAFFDPRTVMDELDAEMGELKKAKREAAKAPDSLTKALKNASLALDEEVDREALNELKEALESSTDPELSSLKLAMHNFNDGNGDKETLKQLVNDQLPARRMEKERDALKGSLQELKTNKKTDEQNLKEVIEKESSLLEKFALHKEELEKRAIRASELKDKLREQITNNPKHPNIESMKALLEIREGEDNDSLKEKIKSDDPDECELANALLQVATQKQKMLETQDEYLNSREDIESLKIYLNNSIELTKSAIQETEKKLRLHEEKRAAQVIYPGKSLFLRAKYSMWGTSSILVSTVQGILSLPFNLAISSPTIINHAINKYDLMNNEINNGEATPGDRALNFGKAGLDALRNVVTTALLPVSAAFLKLSVITGFSDKIHTQKVLGIIGKVGEYLAPSYSTNVTTKKRTGFTQL